MTIAQAIAQLQKLPPQAQLMVSSISHGGSVPLQGFEHPCPVNISDWVDVIYCDDEERERYGLSKEVPHE